MKIQPNGIAPASAMPALVLGYIQRMYLLSNLVVQRLFGGIGVASGLARTARALLVCKQHTDHMLAQNKTPFTTAGEVRITSHVLMKERRMCNHAKHGNERIHLNTEGDANGNAQNSHPSPDYSNTIGPVVAAVQRSSG
jgi:hypothetical protein